jgi:formylglycine-generating enzyme required for sulfatase activity
VWQDNFDPPAATPTLEYDRYALVSRSGLENDFDFLNTPGSTAGFQHPGTYRIQFDSPNQTRAVALARFAYSAFTMQIELSDASDAAATGNLGQGVVVRERDRDHLYAVLLNSRSGQYTVRKLDGKDHWSDLIPWTASPLIKRPGAANRLRVDGKGDQFTVYLNEAVLAHFSDSAYQFGMLGLIGISGDAGKTVLDFDNLAIWSSDTLTGPPATLDAARGMILIPGGEFIMGWYAKPEEQAHIVAVPSFYLDATEVTNKAYKQCIAAGKCSPPDAPAPGDPVPANYFQDPRFDSHPVVYVSWAQAQTFCGWANKRLPTEAEWEKAAGWDSTTRVKTIWPWADNQYDPKRLNSNESNPDLTTPVQHFGPELNGTFDMAGNVREWTSSLNKAYPYNAADGREDPRSPGARIFRGDSWLHTWGKAQTFFREGSPPGDQTADVGFRCAATP